MNWEGDWWFHQVGDTMGTWVVSAEDIVGEQRSDPSLAWLVPQQGFWSDDEVGEPPFLFWFSVLIFWVFFFTFLNGSSLAGAPARLLSDDEVRAPPCLFWLSLFFWMLWASRDTRTWLTQPSDATPGSGADTEEELHCDEPLRILHGLWGTKLCYDGWGKWQKDNQVPHLFCGKMLFAQDTKGLLQGLPPPEVEVFCAHGSQVGRLPSSS